MKYEFVVTCEVEVIRPGHPPTAYDTAQYIERKLVEGRIGKKAVVRRVLVVEKPRPLEERIKELEERLDRMNEDPDY